jgi:stage IV sporulation protein A
LEKYDIFKDIAERTGGDIYVGVVGPVRTGKSTFVKKFMELLVLPNIKDLHERERAKDELPQAGAGRTITTTEPKFIPAEGVEIAFKENIRLKVRMVDCVGYAVDGALGYEEQGGPRMVMTPWFDYEIPFQEAAEVGTRKVLSEHSTIGLVMTSDGTTAEIPRANYETAEDRVIRELKDIGKPFVICLNSSRPAAEETRRIAEVLQAKHDVPVIPMDVLHLSVDDIYLLMEQVLYEFPVKAVNIRLPKWIRELDVKHWLRAKLEGTIEEAVKLVRRVRDVEKAVERLAVAEVVSAVTLASLDMGTGVAEVELVAREELYYKVLSEMTGIELAEAGDLVHHLKDLVAAKREYDVIADALRDVRHTGYGIVNPSMADLTFEEPELIKQGNRYGVRLRARAPSLHFIRADIDTEVTPIIGTEKQGEEMVRFLLKEFEDNPSRLWESNIFGKSLSALVREGIQGKLYRMPENAQQKLQETLQRIINEGSGGLICIII